MSAPHLLVIDGSHTARYRMRLELRRHGAEVTTAASAEAALDLLRAAPARAAPDAVLAHRVLPGMNGLELLELLRTDPRTAALPVVITGVDERWPLRHLALDRGAAALLAPEPDPADLRALLGRLGSHRPTAVSGAAALAAHGWSVGGAGDERRAAGPADGAPVGLAPSSADGFGRHLPFALVVTVTGAGLLALLLSHP